MSYGFDMGFAQANSLQEAMAIALEYTQSQMTEKNIRKTIRDNLYYIPSVRTGYIADEESKNRRADTLADTADRYWLEALFTFRFLYWEEHKLLGIIMMPSESASERFLDIASKLDSLAFDDDPYEYHDNEGVESISDIADNLLNPTYRKAIIKALQDKQEYYAEDEFDDAHIAERATDILDNLAEIFGSDEQED